MSDGRFQTRAKTFLERQADAKREADAKDGGAWRGRRGREAAAPGKGAAESLSSGPASRQTRCTGLAGSRRRLALRILSRMDRLGSRDQTRRDLRRHPNTSRRDPASNTWRGEFACRSWADLSVRRYETQQERRDDRGEDVRQEGEDARQGEEGGDVDDHVIDTSRSRRRSRSTCNPYVCSGRWQSNQSQSSAGNPWRCNRSLRAFRGRIR